MPVAPIALVLSLGATLWLMFVSDASPRAKALAGSVFGSSLVFTYLYPEAWLAGLLLQCVLVVAVATYARVRRR